MRFLIFIVMFLSPSVFACRPAPVSCVMKNVTYDKKKLERFEEKVNTYQTLLTQYLIPPERRTSCFNNHFAGYYIHGLKEELKKHPKTCIDYRLKITNAVTYLVDPDSLENKSVHGVKQKAELKKLGEEIKSELKGLF